VYFLQTKNAKASELEEMAMNLLELNAAEMEIKSGKAIDVSKAALGEALDRLHADPERAVEIDVCDGADGGGQLKKLKVVVFFDGSRSSHRGARVEFETKMKELKESKESKEPTDLEAKVVEEALRVVERPKLARFHLNVDGEAVAVWVPIGSRLGVALREMVVEAMKGTKSDEPMDTKSDEPHEPKGTKSEEPAAPTKSEEPAAQEKEPAAPMKEPMSEPEKEKEAPAAKAMRLKEVAREAAEAARRAAEAAREAKEEAEAEEADLRAAERASTEEELERAIEESMRAAANVESLRSKLARQREEEMQARKRKRESVESADEWDQDESEPDRVPRKEGRRQEAREKEEIVVVKDGEFKAVMGQYEGAVYDAVVERFERTGPGWVGPASGGESVRERVYGEAGKALLGEFPVCTGWDGGEVVVAKGFRDVRKFDGVMELGGFDLLVIDVDERCVNPTSMAEPEWCTDRERVWVKRGSVEHAGLEALIAKGRKCQWQWRWECSPSPGYKPVSQVYRPERPDLEDDEEMSVMD
jgi:hypothetical protein